jgi:hypothetical protein
MRLSVPCTAALKLFIECRRHAVPQTSDLFKLMRDALAWRD